MILAAKDNMYLCFVIPQATANLLHSNINRIKVLLLIVYTVYHVIYTWYFCKFYLKIRRFFVNYQMTLQKGFCDVIAITDVALRKWNDLCKCVHLIEILRFYFK